MAEEVTETRIRTMLNIGIIIAIVLITTATILIPTQNPEEMHTVTFTSILTMPVIFSRPGLRLYPGFSVWSNLIQLKSTG